MAKKKASKTSKASKESKAAKESQPQKDDQASRENEKNQEPQIKVDRRVPFWLVVLGTILIPLATLNWWVHNYILSTNGYVELIAPVAANPAVQTSLANYLTDTIFTRVDTATLLQNAFPNQSQVVIQLVNDALVNFTRERIFNRVQSERFESRWIALNQAFHQRLTPLLKGETERVTLQDGKLTVNLGGIVDRLETGLTNRGLTNLANLIPENDFSYPLFDAPRLAAIQPYVLAMESMFPWVQILIIALFALATWLSRNRAATVTMIGKALFIVSALMAGALLFTRVQILNQAFNEYLTQEVARVIFDALTSPLWLQIGVLGLFGILMANLKRWLKTARTVT